MLHIIIWMICNTSQGYQEISSVESSRSLLINSLLMLKHWRSIGEYPRLLGISLRCLFGNLQRMLEESIPTQTLKCFLLGKKKAGLEIQWLEVLKKVILAPWSYCGKIGEMMSECIVSGMWMTWPLQMHYLYRCIVHWGNNALNSKYKVRQSVPMSVLFNFS